MKNILTIKPRRTIRLEQDYLVNDLRIEYLENPETENALEKRLDHHKETDKAKIEQEKEEEYKEKSDEKDLSYTIMDLIKDFTDYISRQGGGSVYVGARIPVAGYDSPEISDKFNGRERKTGKRTESLHGQYSLDKILEGSHEETPEGYRRTEYRALQRGVKRDTQRFFGRTDENTGDGAIIFVDGENNVVEQYGPANDIAGAKILMDRYLKFINETELGKELKKRAVGEKQGDASKTASKISEKENRIDGYAFMEMGDGVRAAVMKYTVNGEERKVLGINKRYAQRLFMNADDKLTAEETDWYGHEFGHLRGLDGGRYGIAAEQNNDNRLKQIYSGIAGSSDVSPNTRNLAGYLSGAAERRLDSLPAIYSGNFRDN